MRLQRWRHRALFRYSMTASTTINKRNNHNNLNRFFSSFPTPLLLLFPVLVFSCVSFFLNSRYPRSPIPTSILLPHHHILPLPTANFSISSYSSCDYSDGVWIRMPEEESVPTLRYDATCKEIFKGWNCIHGGKDNAMELLKWKWKPRMCELPSMDAVGFLQRYRNKNVGFVGDSLNRNMFVSLVCSLKKVSSEVKKWRPFGADRGFTFLEYNLTVAYHRTNLLVQYGRWAVSSSGGSLESLGYQQGYRVDVDIPAQTWTNAPIFHDILILNTGHWWWAPSKFDPIQSPMIFFENGKPVLPPLSPQDGLDLALKHMILFVERTMRDNSIGFFRTQSPRHFEGGDWNQGGKCPRVQPLMAEEVEHLFSLENKNGTNLEVTLVNEHLFKALRGSSLQILDITRMSEFRADAHPSIAGGKKHEDCMHWCLPGITDIWNDLLVAKLGI